MMKSQILLPLALAGLSAAQSTTVSLFLPNTDPQSLVASVVGTDATATTFVVSCPPGTDASKCGYGGGATVVQGPSTLQLVLLSSNLPLETIACSLAGTTQAVCTSSETLNGYSTSQILTSTLDQAAITYLPVMVTAGAERLGPASTAVAASTTGTSGGAGSASTATTGLVGSLSVAVSSTPAVATASTSSTTGLASSNREASASTSGSATKETSGMSQTQGSSPGASSISNAASKNGAIQSSWLASAVRCGLGSVLGSVLAITIL